MNLDIVILAAGAGTRMRSSLPKVLHRVGGIPLLQHVINTSESLGARKICVVHGHGSEQVLKELKDTRVEWALQSEQLGTGHAVQQVIVETDDDTCVLILYGDVPLITESTLQRLLSCVKSGNIALLTAKLDNPQGYGRIIRNTQHLVESIVEEKDATDAQRLVQEINTGILAASQSDLYRWLGNLKNDNAAQEYYLTDIISIAVKEGVKVETVQADSIEEISGINDCIQLAAIERSYQLRQVETLMKNGVTVYDPSRLDIRGNVNCGQDSYIDVNVILEGDVEIGNGVSIGANTIIKNSRIADGVTINANCVIENADIGMQCHIGPFARIRPETVLSENVRIGNFVEIKKSHIQQGSKVNHLSYVGDATVGKNVNIGAGTITCNYDGANKHHTEIEDDVFIGSDTQLVAPVKIGAGATIGAGSTITRDVTSGDLALSRSKQVVREGWKRPVKNKK